MIMFSGHDSGTGAPVNVGIVRKADGRLTYTLTSMAHDETVVTTIVNSHVSGSVIRLEGDQRGLDRVVTVVPLEYEINVAGGTVAVTVRAVVETLPSGEGSARHERYDPARDLWEATATVNSVSRFENGHEVVIGRGIGGGLTMTVETMVTRDLFF